MVMDLLGNSLEELLSICQRHFSIKTTLILAEQMVSLKSLKGLDLFIIKILFIVILSLKIFF